GRGESIDVSQFVAGAPTVSLETDAQRETARSMIYNDAKQRQLSAVQKHEILRRIATAVGVNFEEFLATGMYQQMTPDQIGALPRDLIDVELHTHRHRMPRSKELFDREIVDNREHLLRY